MHALTVAILSLETRVVDRSTVHAGRRPRLEAIRLQSELEELLRERDHRCVSGPARRQRSLRTDPDGAPKEGSGGEDHPRSREARPIAAQDAANPTPFDEQRFDRSLVKIECLSRLQQRSDRSWIKAPIALGPGRPHGRALRTVQHSKVQHRAVRRAPHDSAQRIHLARHGSLGDAPDRGVTRHLAHACEKRCDEERIRAHPLSGVGGLAARVATPDDDHVV